MLFALIFPRAQRASTYDISAERNVWLQSALRSFAIVCDYMETGLFAIVCDLRSAIRDRLRSSAIVCDHMETSLNSFALLNLRDSITRPNHVIELFSNDCRKTKTKAITLTNHDRGKQRDEPITIPSNYLKLAQSAGKTTRTWRDWFWFCFSLAEKLARVF